MQRVYLIGSLENENVPKMASAIRTLGFHVFDDWYSAGPRADRHWEDYSKLRGQAFEEALEHAASRNVVSFDFTNLMRADIAVLLMPAGRSGHLELGLCAGMGIFRDLRCMIVLEDDTPRWDQMYGLVFRTCKQGKVVRGATRALEVLKSWQ